MLVAWKGADALLSCSAQRRPDGGGRKPREDPALGFDQQGVLHVEAVARKFRADRRRVTFQAKSGRAVWAEVSDGV